MSKLTDKVSYLKGLAAGMKLNMEKDSNKLLLEILGAMGDMAEEMQRMDEAHRELQDYVESIDDDLSDLTETLFSDEEEDDEDADDADECDCEDCADEASCRIRRIFAEVFWSYLLLIDSLTLEDMLRSGAVAEQVLAAPESAKDAAFK